MHTHIWDMPEKERIKAENQKGNKQQTREKFSMNAHSHILRRHGRKKKLNEDRTECNRTALNRTDAVFSMFEMRLADQCKSTYDRDATL